MIRPIARWLSLCVAVALAGVACASQDPTGPPAGELRSWEDISGKFRTEAVMLKFEKGRVHLQRPDGKVLQVPLGKLSRADQQFIRDEMKRRRELRGRETDGSTGQSADQESVWPGWRGPRRDGKSTDQGLLKQWPAEGPPQAWHVSGIGKGYASVSVVDGTIYTTGDLDGKMVITALDMQGEKKWQTAHDAAFTQSHPGSRSTPTIDEGNLYLVSGNGLVGCYDAQTGRGKWQRHLVKEFGGKVPVWGYAESVLIHGDLAIVTPGEANCVVALEKRTGRPVWTSQGAAGGAQYGSCYAFEHGGRPLMVTGTSAGIVAIDPSDGRALWSNPFSAGNTANCPTPVYSDGFVFWANGYGAGGICLELGDDRRGTSAREAWTTRQMDCHHGGYIIHQGHIYGNHGQGWVCLDLKTGDRKWQERGVGKGSVCFADGMLYLFSEKEGRAGLATCSPEAMEMRGTLQVDGDGPSWATSRGDRWPALPALRRQPVLL